MVQAKSLESENASYAMIVVSIMICVHCSYFDTVAFKALVTNSKFNLIMHTIIL